MPGAYTSRGNDNEWGQRLADILTRIMDKDLAVIRAEYDRAVRTEHPGAVGGWSWDFAETAVDAAALVLPVGAVSPSTTSSAATIPASPSAPRCAGASTASTTASASSARRPAHRCTSWASPMPSSGPWGLRREFTLFDEIAIWKQILLHTGAVN